MMNQRTRKTRSSSFVARDVSDEVSELSIGGVSSRGVPSRSPDCRSEDTESTTRNFEARSFSFNRTKQKRSKKEPRSTDLLADLPDDVSDLSSESLHRGENIPTKEQLGYEDMELMDSKIQLDTTGLHTTAATASRDSYNVLRVLGLSEVIRKDHRRRDSTSSSQYLRRISLEYKDNETLPRRVSLEFEEFPSKRNSLSSQRDQWEDNLLRLSIGSSPGYFRRASLGEYTRTRHRRPRREDSYGNPASSSRGEQVPLKRVTRHFSITNSSPLMQSRWNSVACRRGMRSLSPTRTRPGRRLSIGDTPGSHRRASLGLDTNSGHSKVYGKSPKNEGTPRPCISDAEDGDLFSITTTESISSSTYGSLSTTASSSDDLSYLLDSAAKATMDLPTTATCTTRKHASSFQKVQPQQPQTTHTDACPCLPRRPSRSSYSSTTDLSSRVEADK